MCITGGIVHVDHRRTSTLKVVCLALLHEVELALFRLRDDLNRKKPMLWLRVQRTYLL